MCDPQKILKLEEKYCDEMKSMSANEIGLAVSGGGDSLALLLMASKWAKLSNRSLSIVTVDHSLRQESRGEAIYVGRIANRLGHPHEILDWSFGRRKGNLQAEAALARKKLISQWAKKKSIKTVLLGHTLDDQAENFLMRMARGSGVDGLSGMKRIKSLHGINWFRPLLSFYRKDLRYYLDHREINWIEDPSNEDTRYTRVKARSVLKELQVLGVNPMGLVETSKRMEKAVKVLNDTAVQAGKKYLKLREWGDIEIDKKLFKAARDETYLRLLAHLIKFISGSIYRPRYQDLIKFASALSVDSFKARTIGGVIARSLSEDMLVLRREPSVPGFITDIPSKKFIWDGRWEITVGTNQLGNSERIGPLGEVGLSQIQKGNSISLPRESLRSLPTLFYKEKVLASPILNYGKGLVCRLAYTKCDLINSLIID